MLGGSEPRLSKRCESLVKPGGRRNDEFSENETRQRT